MSPIGTFKIISPLLGNPLIQRKSYVTSTKVFVMLTKSFDQKFWFIRVHEFGQMNKNLVKSAKVFF